MTAINGYITLSEFKRNLRAGGVDLSVDTVDDLVLEDIIEEASRYIDIETGRHFYPVVETRTYDTPEGTLDDRVLWLDDDLLEVTTVTNGDDTTLAATEYKLYPANYYPKYALRIRQSSGYYWLRDDDDNSEQVIDVLGWWGFHDDYAREAWGTGSTLNEGALLTAVDLTWTMASVTPFEVGQIVKIESELCIVATVTTGATPSITVRKRGDNGSTAATHADTTAVTIWQPIRPMRRACMDIATNYHKRRYGEATAGTATITGAGVVISPGDVSAHTQRILADHRRAV